MSLNDAKYWELKYKYEFLVAVGSIVVAVVAFIGYSTLNDVKANLKLTLSAQVDSVKSRVDSVSKNISGTEISANALNKKVSTTNERITEFKTDIGKLKRSQSDLDLLNQKIKDLQSKNIVIKEFYIVDKLTVQTNMDKLDKFSFKNLKTIDGDNLPKFISSPIVIPLSRDNGMYTVAKVTNEYVTLAFKGPGYFSTPEAPTDHDYDEKAKKNYTITLLIYDVK
ncbi:hypothetical protein GCM10007352_07090 [Mucilaginibacter phyllosphaerae]|nr:hypothetical protein GCM10007352_07090 [Mucilaginibacter phyllosphaerae]